MVAKRIFDGNFAICLTFSSSRASILSIKNSHHFSVPALSNNDSTFAGSESGVHNSVHLASH